jgi:hypothetical protein
MLSHVLAALHLKEDIAMYAIDRSLGGFQATSLLVAERNIPAVSGNRTLVTYPIASHVLTELFGSSNEAVGYNKAVEHSRYFVQQWRS